MRGCWLIAGLIVGACYSPTAPAGAPCTPAENNCPAPQSCVEISGSFLCSFGPGDNPDAQLLVDTATDADETQIDASPDASPIDAPQVQPINFVQEATNKPTLATTTLALPDAVTNHDTLIVCLNIPTGGATLVSATDSLGNHYDTVFGPYTGSSSDHYIFVARNSVAGADTFTLTLSAAPTGGSDMFLLEYSGLVGFVNPFDVSSVRSDTVTTLDSGSATTHFAHELILGYAEANNTTAGTGFTQRAVQSGNLVEDRVVNAIGSYSTGATTAAAGPWTMTMATFRGH